jgi:DNA uptake protein ComE-like DNA-binding protein
MKFLNFFHTYFGFNKRERNGLLVFISLILVLLVIRFSITAFVEKPVAPQIIKVSPEANEKNYQENYSSYTKRKKKKQHHEKKNIFFVFDPNTISEKDAVELGFSKKTASTLSKFREKGGKFFKKEDLKKLYGISDEFYESIKDYVIIEAKTAVKSDSVKQQKNGKFSPIELNEIDSVQLVKLRKIGPYTTKKILKFRNSLGGFYDIQQLKEVYGMNDSLFIFLSENTFVEPNKIKSIQINSATYNDLKQHPYIDHIIASTIVAYREKHGKYKQLSDLLSIGTISESKLGILKYYFSFD